MRLDLDFIKEILSEIEEHKGSRLLLDDLINALKILDDNDAQLDRLGGHLRLMRDAGLIACNRDDCGFISNQRNEILLNTNAQFEMTMPGYQMLDALRNDNLMGKIRSYLSEVGMSGVKKAPGFVIGIATDYLLKQAS